MDVAEKIQSIARALFRAFVVCMVILIFDDKAFYCLPLGLLIGLLSEAKSFIKPLQDPSHYVESQIKFAEWISENSWIQSSDDLWYYKSDGGGGGKGITTSDLFRFYSKNKN